MGIFDELKNNFKHGNTLTKLIYVNIGVFIFIELIKLFFKIFYPISFNLTYSSWLAFSSNSFEFITHPWTLLTYQFIHADIWHIFFNLLWLYWFGQIFLEYLDQKKLLSVYLLGGFSGAILYFAVYNLIMRLNLVSIYSSMVGASAAIMSIVIAISVIVPNYKVNLFLIGPVQLKYIAIVTIFIDLISIQDGNAGGHISHLGGALFGYIFAIQYKKGIDISKRFTLFLDKLFSLFKFKKKMKVSYKRPVDDYDYNKMKVDQQKEIDRILDKIAKGGYESLSKQEKDFLFRSSH